MIYLFHCTLSDNSHSAALQKTKSAENMKNIRYKAHTNSKTAIIPALQNTYFP